MRPHNGTGHLTFNFCGELTAGTGAGTGAGAGAAIGSVEAAGFPDAHKDFK